jgi:hypothetical protein
LYNYAGGVTSLRTLIVLMLPFFIASSTYKPAQSVEVLWYKGIIKSTAQYSAKTDSRGLPANFSDEDTTLSRSRTYAYNESSEAAKQNIASMIGSLSVDSENTVSDLLESYPEFQEALNATLYTRIKVRQYPSDFFSAKCIATMKISEIISALPYEFPQNPFPVPYDARFKTAYTSIIIDMRGFEHQPMIFPSIYDEDGLEVYGRQFIDPKIANANGAVSYCYGENEAAKHKKAGDRPFYTSAIRALKGNPVISHSDVRKFYGHSGNLLYLKQCKVIFIIDRENSGKQGKHHE